MTENRRDSLRSRPTPWVRPGPRANAVLLYVVGRSIPRSDRHDLEALLDRFHASDELQARCVTVDTNARRYLTLHEVGSDQCYKSSTFIPAGTLLAAYSGSRKGTTFCITFCIILHNFCIIAISLCKSLGGPSDGSEASRFLPPILHNHYAKLCKDMQNVCIIIIYKNSQELPWFWEDF